MPVWEAEFIFRLTFLLPCVSMAQEDCWTYGCSTSGNSHGALIICERKEQWSKVVWMNVCIWGVFALSFTLLFLFSLLCHLPWSDTVWPEWAKMQDKWNCPGRPVCLQAEIHNMHIHNMHTHTHTHTYTHTNYVTVTECRLRHCEQWALLTALRTMERMGEYAV